MHDYDEDYYRITDGVILGAALGALLYVIVAAFAGWLS